MTDIVTRLRLCDEQMVALDHLNRPYGLTKSLEHEAADEIDRLRAERDRLQDREKHFALLLSVPDGGRYRHDWDARLTGLLAERNRLREELRRIAYDDRVGDEAINLDDTPRAIARAALGEDKT